MGVRTNPPAISKRGLKRSNLYWLQKRTAYHAWLTQGTTEKKGCNGAVEFIV